MLGANSCTINEISEIARTTLGPCDSVTTDESNNRMGGGTATVHG